MGKEERNSGSVGRRSDTREIHASKMGRESAGFIKERRWWYRKNNWMKKMNPLSNPENRRQSLYRDILKHSTAQISNFTVILFIVSKKVTHSDLTEDLLTLLWVSSLVVTFTLVRREHYYPWWAIEHLEVSRSGSSRTKCITVTVYHFGLEFQVLLCQEWWRLSYFKNCLKSDCFLQQEPSAVRPMASFLWATILSSVI